MKYTKFLITGGTGTFGKACARHLLETGADRVVLLARHEAEMAAAEAELAKYSSKLRPFIGDVRDRDRLEMAFRGCEVVIHAAALKRIEQCERDPIEAVKTNVLGTKNVIEAALQCELRQCILLSTDKAVAPVNLYGATKLAAERLWIAANNLAAGRCTFAVARYGNIFASRGSVVPRWRQLVAENRPLRISDPRSTRYFMRIADAVALVEGLLTHRIPGEIKIPSLAAYQLSDLAEAIAGRDYPTIEVGMPEWEKLHETMDGITDSSQARRMTVDELRYEVMRL